MQWLYFTLYYTASTHGNGSATLPISISQALLGIGNTSFGDLIAISFTNTSVTCYFDTYAYPGSGSTEARVLAICVS